MVDHDVDINIITILIISLEHLLFSNALFIIHLKCKQALKYLRMKSVRIKMILNMRVWSSCFYED